MPKTRGTAGNGRFPRSRKAENPTIGARGKHNQLALSLAQVLAQKQDFDSRPVRGPPQVQEDQDMPEEEDVPFPIADQETAKALLALRQRYKHLKSNIITVVSYLSFAMYTQRTADKDKVPCPPEGLFQHQAGISKNNRDCSSPRWIPQPRGN